MSVLGDIRTVGPMFSEVSNPCETLSSETPTVCYSWGTPKERKAVLAQRAGILARGTLGCIGFRIHRAHGWIYRVRSRV